jgi:hypothetical protein
MTSSCCVLADPPPHHRDDDIMLLGRAEFFPMPVELSDRRVGRLKGGTVRRNRLVDLIHVVCAILAMFDDNAVRPCATESKNLASYCHRSPLWQYCRGQHLDIRAVIHRQNSGRPCRVIPQSRLVARFIAAVRHKTQRPRLHVDLSMAASRQHKNAVRVGKTSRPQWTDFTRSTAASSRGISPFLQALCCTATQAVQAAANDLDVGIESGIYLGKSLTRSSRLRRHRPAPRAMCVSRAELKIVATIIHTMARIGLASSHFVPRRPDLQRIWMSWFAPPSASQAGEHTMPKLIASIVTTVSTIFLAAAIVLGMSPPAHATAECIQGPSQHPTEGAHWYYHLDRANSRKCWYLVPEAPKLPEADTSQRQAGAPPPPLFSSLFSSLFGPTTAATTAASPDTSMREPRIIQANPARTLKVDDIVQKGQPSLPEERAEQRYTSPLNRAQREALFQKFLQWDESQRITGGGPSWR